VSVTHISELLQQDALDEAVSELKQLETAAGADGSQTVVISAMLERMRRNNNLQLISNEDLNVDRNNLIIRILSIAENFEREIENRARRTVRNPAETDQVIHGTVGSSAQRTSTLEVQQKEAKSETTGDVLLLIHGIRTHAEWFATVQNVMSSQVPCQVVAIKYGYFDVVRFLWPIGIHGWPIQKVAAEIRKAKAKYPNAKISAIAHSFGTYALMHALEDPTFELDRVILCGSVLPERFNIERYFFSTEDIRIVNDSGVRDVWPVMAKCLTWGYGATGTFGIGTVGIQDRFFPFSHSDFFRPDFIIKYWVPFIRDGSIVQSDLTSDQALSPRWFSTMISPVWRWAIWSTFGIILLALLFWIVRAVWLRG
jgi:hypothetical protein